jgi:hypothetical protein
MPSSIADSLNLAVPEPRLGLIDSGLALSDKPCLGIELEDVRLKTTPFGGRFSLRME